jgi:hypothetical protein
LALVSNEAGSMVKRESSFHVVQFVGNKWIKNNFLTFWDTDEERMALLYKGP